jgi:4-amino-4-deoxy-L-arabinose transferase-like glycosyltransferase
MSQDVICRLLAAFRRGFFAAGGAGIHCPRKKSRTERYLLWALIGVFFAANLAFLTRYPFVHSDESWLAGLTRDMMETGSPAVTESFFDLKPRRPHAVKILFHLMQMPFIAAFGYSAFSVRLLTLCCGCGALWLFYRCARRLLPSAWMALGATCLLAVDAQFVASAHLARQEMPLCVAMLACTDILLGAQGPLRRREVLALALITGLSVGLHPNSFLLAAMCGCALLVRLVVMREGAVKDLLLYAAVTGALAAVFVAVSLWMNPRFFADYLAYGEAEFEITRPLGAKAGELGYYFEKLWHRVSGTYFVPELRPQMVLFPLVIGLALLYASVMRREDAAGSRGLWTLLGQLAGLLAGIVMIGRYSQPAAVFWLPSCWLLFAFACTLFGKWGARLLPAVAAAVLLTASASSIGPWMRCSYEEYLADIARFVPADSRVIANLNTGFYFEGGCLLDYRNLPYLEENGLGFSDYVRERGVRYILWSDELDYIHATRPQWNMLYGNLRGWDEMRRFVEERCELVGRLTDNTYAVRIVGLMNGERDFGVSIYRVSD